MDIIVTTPKSQRRAAAREAADVIAAGGGEYFRRFPLKPARPSIDQGERLYYVENGFVRGFCIVSRVELRRHPQTCQTTRRVWPPGFYVYMDATTWKWVRPVAMKGFQGFRYADRQFERTAIEVVGGWLDPRPT